jgi:hypothetical protein
MTFKELLAVKEMSGYYFSKHSGIHQPAVSNLVTGKRDPLNMRVYTCKKAAETLGMSLVEFYEVLDNKD